MPTMHRRRDEAPLPRRGIDGYRPAELDLRTQPDRIRAQISLGLDQSLGSARIGLPRFTLE
jgi:hypothetical protein